MTGAEALEQVDAQELDRLFDQNLVAIIVVVAILVALYVLAPRYLRPVVRRTLQAQSGAFEDGGVAAVELEKRARTIESLALALIRVAVVLLLGFIVVGVLGLWSLLTGIGLFLAALTLAGQSIVLDYLMGVLIVVEGTYFEGDSISAGDPSWNVAGTVERVGLRYTAIRSPGGTVHSISNGLMRQVSNRTRVYAGADVTIRGIREQDLATVIEAMNSVGESVAQAPEHAGHILEVPQFAFLDDPDDLGWSATMRGKVLAGERWVIATDIRRRLVEELLRRHVELSKRSVAPPPS